MYFLAGSGTVFTLSLKLSLLQDLLPQPSSEWVPNERATGKVIRQDISATGHITNRVALGINHS
ncbi:MAG: hypothetical protein LBC80_07840 [Treponema sp.]|jgi:hypothetical protein|nr:hypothetical protein [Treponema sp.]